MDIQKENDLIQEAFEVEADEIGFCLDQKWGDYENPYENSDTALAFNLFKKGWQAAHRIPEDHVLVPKKELQEVLTNASDAMGDEKNSNVYLTTGEPSTWFDHFTVAENAVLKAIKDQEQNHE